MSLKSPHKWLRNADVLIVLAEINNHLLCDSICPWLEVQDYGRSPYIQ